MTDRKTATASAIFFAVALINPRDFPIDNLPLIYPAFLLFWMQMGTRTMLRGFTRVRFLLILLVGYQVYFTALKLYLGQEVPFGDYAYILEPPMILLAASAAAVRPGGTKAATWAMVWIIAFMAAWGVGIYTIGEPFTSVRSMLQRSIGGTLATGAMMRDTDFEVGLTDLISINSGLSSDPVIFGYMLSAATALVVCAMLARKPTAGVSYGYLTLGLLLLIAGIITNTERATLVGVVVGAGVFMYIGSLRKTMSRRTLSLLVVGTISVLALVMVSQRWADKSSLLNRGFADPKSLVRLYMVVPSVASIMYQPLGAGGLSAHYEDVAFSVGWLTTRDGIPQAHSPHNHFAGIIMYAGIVGLLAGVLLLGSLIKRLKRLRKEPKSLYAKLLAGACVASVFHSFFHNAGFFGLVPSTQIVFGLLWSETWMPRGRRPSPVSVSPHASPLAEAAV